MKGTLTADGIIEDSIVPELFGHGNINATGVITQSAASDIYDLYVIPVTEYTSISVSVANLYGYFSSVPVVGSQAMDNTRHTGSASGLDISVTSGCVYVVIRVDTGVVPTVKNAVQQELITSKVADLTAEVDEISDTLDGLTANRGISIDDYTTVDEYFMSYNGNASGPYSNWSYITLTVNPGEKYLIDTMAGQSARAWVCFDSSDAVISCSSENGAVAQRTELVTIPDSGATLVVNGRSDGYRTVLSEPITAIDENKIIINGRPLPEVIESGAAEDVLHGKILCAVGDSITYGADMDAEGITSTSHITMYQYNDASGTWVEVESGFRHTWNYDIAARNGMTLYNGGISGSTMQSNEDTASKYPFSLANGRYTKLPDTLDYLIIWFGWNDSAYGTLGTIDDATNATYCGGYNVVMQYLINKYPHAKIGIVLPYIYNDTLADKYAEATRQIAEKWGVGIFDIQGKGTPLYYRKDSDVSVEASVVTARRNTFQAAGAHPNHIGHEYLSTMIEAWVRSL